MRLFLVILSLDLNYEIKSCNSEFKSHNSDFFPVIIILYLNYEIKSYNSELKYHNSDFFL